MHRKVNSEIAPGLAIVSGIEQGISVFSEKSIDFIVENSLDIYNNERLSCEMDGLLKPGSIGGPGSSC